MIRENLANKRIAITGSTGFVGTALVERLLRAVPECTLVLLVRPSKRHDATERVRREIFKNDAFDRLRRRCGVLEVGAIVDFFEMGVCVDRNGLHLPRDHIERVVVAARIAKCGDSWASDRHLCEPLAAYSGKAKVPVGVGFDAP